MRAVLALAAMVLTGLALSLLITRPTTTFTMRNHDELVVACHTVVVAADDEQRLNPPMYRSHHYKILEGEDALKSVEKQESADHAGPFKPADLIEAQCDRRRTGRVAGSMVLLAPAVFLASTATAYPAIQRASRTKGIDRAAA